MSDPIGQTFGSYLLESLIGAGPNGKVYRARQVRLNRPAAVKIIAARLANLPDFSRRFSAATQRAAALRNGQIADIEDFGEQAGLSYIAMELYEEGSLRSFLQQRVRQRDPWELAPVLDLVRQAVDGIAAAHQVGIMHGHLKPENILLQKRAQGMTSGYRARVSDFGVLEFAGAAPITSLAYTTPEQTRGEQPTVQSDIYALGVVLYEVTTGYVPFAVKTPEEAAAKHGGAQPVPPRMVRAQLPIELEALILRCLAKRPDQRFGSAQELSQALGTVIPGPTPGQTVLLSGLPTQALAQPPQQATQAMQIDQAQQPTVRAPVVSAAQQPTMLATNLPRVELIDAQGNVQRALDLTGAGLTFGRAPENALVLENEQISRLHVRVDWNGKQATLSDLGSANGTLLDGTRIPPNVPVPWGWTQRAQVGPFTLRVVPPPGLVMQPAAQQATDPLLQGLLGGTPTRLPAAATPSAPTQAFNAGLGAAKLSLVLDQEQLTLTPGQRAVLNVTVINNSGSPDAVTISVEGAPGMWIGVPQQAAQVATGGRSLLTIAISVPREAESLAGDYPVIVRARSSANPGESATSRGRWTVLPFVASSISITPRRANGRRDASYQVTVRNDGNQTETFRLNADDDAQELRYSFSDESVTLEPGQAETVGLLVTGPGRMVGGSDSFSFRISAQAGNERPSTANAQFVSEAAISPAIPIALAALAAVAVLFFVLNRPGDGGVAGVATAIASATATATQTATPTAAPGAPVVNQFAVDPLTVAPNQVVTIIWNVSGATSVDINALGTGLPPQGKGQRVVDKTTDIVMKINWSGGSFERRIQAIVATPVPPSATPLPPTTAPSATPLPPSAVPPSATPLPPSATPLPPSATPLPPSATPLPPSATSAPAATNVPLPAAQPINLASAAQNAVWSNSATPTIGFGKPSAGSAGGGWAETQLFAQIEGGQFAQGPLYTIPITSTGGFVAGTYQVAAIGKDQKFLADIALPNNTKDTTIKAQVLFSGVVIFEVQKAADGKVLPISIDLANFVGSSGTLTLRAENVINPGGVGLYWLRPRLDTR